MRGRSSGGGGGRSHSSSRSSFSSGRSHSSSSFRSSGRSHHRDMGPGPGPRHVVHHHVGGGYYGGGVHTTIHIGGPAGKLIGLAIAFIILFVLPYFMFLGSINSTITEIENSYYYYQNMIEVAKSDSRYVKKGQVLEIHEDSKYDNAWYLRYVVFENGTSGETVDGNYTFSVYTDEEIENISVGDFIDIAVDNPTTPIFDSIDMHYGDVAITDDPEYHYSIVKRDNLKSGFIIYGLILGGVYGLILTITIVKAVKNKDNKSEQLDSATTGTTTAATPTTKYCAYCGSALEDGTKCKVCGARNK